MKKETAVKIAFDCVQPLAGKCDQYLIYLVIENIVKTLMQDGPDEI